MYLRPFLLEISFEFRIFVRVHRRRSLIKFCKVIVSVERIKFRGIDFGLIEKVSEES